MVSLLFLFNNCSNYSSSSNANKNSIEIDNSVVGEVISKARIFKPASDRSLHIFLGDYGYRSMLAFNSQNQLSLVGAEVLAREAVVSSVGSFPSLRVYNLQLTGNCEVPDGVDSAIEFTVTRQCDKDQDKNNPLCFVTPPLQIEQKSMPLIVSKSEQDTSTVVDICTAGFGGQTVKTGVRCIEGRYSAQLFLCPKQIIKANITSKRVTRQVAAVAATPTTPAVPARTEDYFIDSNSCVDGQGELTLNAKMPASCNSVTSSATGATREVCSANFSVKFDVCGGFSSTPAWYSEFRGNGTPFKSDGTPQVVGNGAGSSTALGPTSSSGSGTNSSASGGSTN